MERLRPAYAVIEEILRERIRSGALSAGTVLLEGPLAELFRSSRSPVKQALSQLERDGLVRRFGGRGVAVGGAAASLNREKVTAETLGLDKDAAETQKVPAWQTLYYAVERDLILHSVLGRFRVNELALARHLDVGRTVARDVLTQAQAVGILVKEGNAHWSLVPLGEERFRDLYELRILLEPVALKAASARMPRDVLQAMERRLLDVAAQPSRASVADLDALENDLHVTCLAHGGKAEIAGALSRARCILVAGKHIQAALRRMPLIDPFMEEHLAIVRAMLAGEGDRAAAALVGHLTTSRDKAASRLRAFHAVNAIRPVPYIVG